MQTFALTSATAGTFRLTSGGEKTTPLPYNATDDQVMAAIQALKSAPHVSVSHSTAGPTTAYTVTFPVNRNVDQLGVDGSMLGSDDSKSLLVLDAATGVLGFNLDLPFGVNFSRPFSLDLSQITDSLPAALKAITSLVGLSGSGNLAVSASGQLQLRMGLDVASRIVTSTQTQGNASTDEAQQVFVKATGGSFTLWFDANKNTSKDPGEVTSATTVTGGPGDDYSSAIRDALDGLAAIGAGGVTVAKDPGQQLYTITFVGTAGTFDSGAGVHFHNVPQLAADAGNLTGGDTRAFFLKTGDDGTKLAAHVTAAGTNLNFQAKLGPFGLFVKNGSAGAGGQFSVQLLAPGGDDRLDLIAYGDSGVSSDLGRLLFLALHVMDGVDTNGDGPLRASVGAVNPQTEEFSTVYFNGSVDLVDPTTSPPSGPNNKNDDGLLTMSELVSYSPLKVFQVSRSGGALFRADATVDFSTLGGDLGNVLPSVSTKILVDFGLGWSPGSSLSVTPPQVVLADVTLDLGSFISKFAAPILKRVADILGPLDWLIERDGFLNKLIPIFFNLAGHMITGKDLVILFDQDDGPKIVAFLNFVDQLYYLTKLVKQAANEGDVKRNFGDLVLFDNTAAEAAGRVANLSLLKFIDKRINLGSDTGGGSLASGTADLRQLRTLANINLDGLQLPQPSTQSPAGRLGRRGRHDTDHPGRGRPRAHGVGHGRVVRRSPPRRQRRRHLRRLGHRRRPAPARRRQGKREVCLPRLQQRRDRQREGQRGRRPVEPRQPDPGREQQRR